MGRLLQWARILPRPPCPHTPTSIPAAAAPRCEIAARRRMMAEDGISDFGFAKRKGGEQLSATDADARPTTTRSRPAAHLAWRSTRTREQAAAPARDARRRRPRSMRLLADLFTHRRNWERHRRTLPELEIELFPDSTKDVEIFFLNQDFAYEALARAAPPALQPPEAILSFDWDDVPVKVSIYPRRAQPAPRLDRVCLARYRVSRLPWRWISRHGPHAPEVAPPCWTPPRLAAHGARAQNSARTAPGPRHLHALLQITTWGQFAAIYGNRIHEASKCLTTHLHRALGLFFGMTGWCFTSTLYRIPPVVASYPGRASSRAASARNRTSPPPDRGGLACAEPEHWNHP